MGCNYQGFSLQHGKGEALQGRTRCPLAQAQAAFVSARCQGAVVGCGLKTWSTACAVLHLTLLHPPKTLRLVLLFDMLVPLFDATSPRRVKQSSRQKSMPLPS